MAIYQPLNESALIKCFQGPFWVEKKMMSWISVLMSVLQVSNDIHQSGTAQLNRQSRLTWLICARSHITLIICHPSRVTENPFAMRVFCSALLCSWQRRQKSKEVREWPECLSFIFNCSFSSPFLFETSKLWYSQFLSLRTRHLEPWNTRKIVHI